MNLLVKLERLMIGPNSAMATETRGETASYQTAVDRTPWSLGKLEMLLKITAHRRIRQSPKGPTFGGSCTKR